MLSNVSGTRKALLNYIFAREVKLKGLQKVSVFFQKVVGDQVVRDF